MGRESRVLSSELGLRSLAGGAGLFLRIRNHVVFSGKGRIADADRLTDFGNKETGAAPAASLVPREPQSPADSFISAFWTLSLKHDLMIHQKYYKA